MPDWFVQVPSIVLIRLTLPTTGKNLLGKGFKRGEWRPLGILEMIYLLRGTVLFLPFPERVDGCNASVSQESCFKGPEDQAKTSVAGPAVCVITGVVSALKGATPSRAGRRVGVSTCGLLPGIPVSSHDRAGTCPACLLTHLVLVRNALNSYEVPVTYFS